MHLFDRMRIIVKHFHSQVMMGPATVSLVLFSVAVLILTQQPVVASPPYTVTDLGTLGGAGSSALCLSSTGQIVGEAATNSGLIQDIHAFFWQNNQLTDLDTLGGHNSCAISLNNAGQIVGQAQTGAADQHAALWQAGKVTDLGLSGGSVSIAVCINNRSQVVGSAYTSSGTAMGNAINRACLWQNGKMTDLGTLGGTESSALGINDIGQIVGFAQTAAGLNHAFLWQNRKMADLGTLGGAASVARAVNQKGLIVGEAQTASGAQHAVFWQNKQIVDLQPLGSPFSDAFGVNNLGMVVGFAEMPNGDFHAFLGKGTTIYDLNTWIPASSGWMLEKAYAIADTGQIVGIGRVNGLHHGFLLTPLLPTGIVNDTGSVQVTRSIPTYDKVSRMVAQTLTLTNVSANAVSGPFQVVITGLPTGVNWVNATGKHLGQPYVTVSNASLAAGASANVQVSFHVPTKSAINIYTTTVYSGAW